MTDHPHDTTVPGATQPGSTQTSTAELVAALAAMVQAADALAERANSSVYDDAIAAARAVLDDATGHAPTGDAAPSGEPLICRCGAPMSVNPHPDAGDPARILDVGATYVCIPCSMGTLGRWATRARRAEADARHYAQRLRDEGIDPDAGLA